MKKMNYVVALIMLASLCGCVSGMVASGMKSAAETTAIGGDFLLHKNPKVGDYAVCKFSQKAINKAGGYVIDMLNSGTRRYEITSIKDGVIVVTMTGKIDSVKMKMNGVERETPDAGQQAPTITEYHVDTSGKIKEVWMKNAQYGVNAKFKQANPGENGYISYRYEKKGEKMKVAAGEFDVKPAWFATKVMTQANTFAFDANVDAQQVNISYLNAGVPFQKVVTHMTFYGSASAQTTIGDKVGKLISILSLTTFIVNPAAIATSLNPIDFIKGNINPAKADVAKKMLGDIEIDIKDFSGSEVEYLVEYGKK